VCSLLVIVVAYRRKEEQAQHLVRVDSAFLSCDAKGKEPLMSHDHQHPQHKHIFQLLEGHGSLPSNPQEQRRAVLWRQRMKLEFEMQGLFVRSTTLVQEWQYLHGS